MIKVHCCYNSLNALSKYSLHTINYVKPTKVSLMNLKPCYWVLVPG